MSFEYDKLRGRIVEKYGSVSKFAEKLEISYTAISNKINGKAGFSQKDIVEWCKLLDIDIMDAPLFFLTTGCKCTTTTKEANHDSSN